MAHLIDAVEASLETDFAILFALQERAAPDGSPAYADSGPGFVSMETGYRHSRVHLRIERWDEQPPNVGGWEDIDELPFEEVPGAGRLMLMGFDESDVGLDIEGFGRGRVQVFARGRHRYSYSHSSLDVEELDPEEWLLRLYPFQGQVDPMAGDPRRISGAGGAAYIPGSAWQAAIHAHSATGWHRALSSSHGYYLANLALYGANSALTRLELASLMVRGMSPWQLGGSDAESTDVPRRSGEDTLATLSGRESIGTTGDAIDALVDIGLLLVEEREGKRLLVPNPAPQPTWERLALAGEHLKHARAAALETEHRRSASTIVAAARWCPMGLTATPRSMAIRWGASVDEIVGAIRLLGGTGKVTSDPPLDFDADLSADEPVTLWATGRMYTA